MRIKLSKNTSARISPIKEDYSFPYIIYIGSKHRKNFIIDLWLVEIDISWSCDDWMIKSKEIIAGKEYDVFTRNPKYTDEYFQDLHFPPHIENGKLRWTYTSKEWIKENKGKI